MKEKNFFNKFRSPMPKNLTQQEREEWEKDIEWEKQEYERRKKEGFYSGEEGSGIVSKIIKKFRFRAKNHNNNTEYFN